MYYHYDYYLEISYTTSVMQVAHRKIRGIPLGAQSAPIDRK